MAIVISHKCVTENPHATIYKLKACIAVRNYIDFFLIELFDCMRYYSRALYYVYQNKN